MDMQALIQRLGDGRFRFQRLTKQIKKMTPREQEQIKILCMQRLTGRARTIALYRLQVFDFHSDSSRTQQVSFGFLLYAANFVRIPLCCTEQISFGFPLYAANFILDPRSTQQMWGQGSAFGLLIFICLVLCVSSYPSRLETSAYFHVQRVARRLGTVVYFKKF